MDPDDDGLKRRRQVVLLSTIPMVLIAGPLIGFFIGQFIDQKFGTAPWVMVFFLIIGATASVKQTLRLLTRAQEK